jgi:Na+-driven multidrug efflux pump
VTVLGAPDAIAFSDPAPAMIEKERRALALTPSPDGTAAYASFASDNAAVAAVDAATGEISALAIGEATITATSFNGKTASCKLTVLPGPDRIDVPATVLLGVIHFRKHIHCFPLSYFRPMPWQELRHLLHIGIPAMSENISYNLSQVVVMFFINQISNEALAARTYCANMIMFVYLFCLSITQGGDILVGHLVGQRRHQAAYVLGNYFFRRSMIISLTGSAILALTGKSILSFFTDNQEIIAMGVWVLIIDWFLEIGRTANIFAVSTLRATGDAVYPVVVGIIFNWTVAVGLSYVVGIPLGYGLVGMWVAFALDENIRGIILMRRWRSGIWRKKGFVG